MRHVAVIFFGVFSFILLIFAVRWVGSLQPPPAALEQLHLTDCTLPCWLGITPGITRFDEAAQSITATYPDATTLRNSVILADFSPDASYARVSLQAQDGIISWVLLTLDDSNHLAIGDLVALFGSPSCPPPLSNQMIIYTAPQSFASVMASRSIRERWHKPLISIDIGVSRRSVCQFAPGG
ncbi:MAG: hypothetical protein ABI835_02665 [Chloroflexota bacterium]